MSPPSLPPQPAARVEVVRALEGLSSRHWECPSKQKLHGGGHRPWRSFLHRVPVRFKPEGPQGFPDVQNGLGQVGGSHQVIHLGRALSTRLLSQRPISGACDQVTPSSCLLGAQPWVMLRQEDSLWRSQGTPAVH